MAAVIVAVLALAIGHRVLNGTATSGLMAGLRHSLPEVIGLSVLAALFGILVVRSRLQAAGAQRPRRANPNPPGPGWATPRDLDRAGLTVRSPPGDRLVLGTAGQRLLAAERRQSLLVVGPSQSGKTTNLAIPALLEWRGPVLATSVKTDLVRDTVLARRERGDVAVFDPTGLAGMSRAGWSPIARCGTWSGARKVAESLCSLGRQQGGMEDAGFWYASAERLLAPLLLAAALTGGSMSDVVAWLDEEDLDRPSLALDLAGEREAARVHRSSMSLEERQRSSVFSTAQTVVAAYADPEVVASEQALPQVGGEWLIGQAPGALPPAGAGPDGRSESESHSRNHRTLYCCAPARDQARLSPVFVALVREVIDAAFVRASATGQPLDPPLLLLLDEAANVAPLPDLDGVLATAAGHGVVLMTVWQDLAQIEARYGPRWSTIVNNHRAKVVFPGVADPRTLELVSSLIGDAESTQRSRTVAADGSWSESEGEWRVPVAPAGWIRRLPERSAIALYGGLAPALISQRGRGRGRV